MSEAECQHVFYHEKTKCKKCGKTASEVFK